MTQELKDRAFQLRYGCKYSYGDIHKELNISKGTLNYWFSKDGREKQKQRTKQYRQNPENKLRRKILSAGFDLTNISTTKLVKKYKITQCYICGLKINTLKEYCHIDHIHPKSKGGSVSLDNMAIVHKECNIMKSDLELNDFINKIELIYNYQKINKTLSFLMGLYNHPKTNKIKIDNLFYEIYTERKFDLKKVNDMLKEKK